MKNTAKGLVGAGAVGILALAIAASSSEPVAPVNKEASTYVQTTKEAPPVIVPKVQAKASATVQRSAPAKQSCNSNYSGCLNPDASDYDCSGGSGNGPYYTGAVQVLGYDEYGLDRDGDGWGCE